MNVTAQYDAIVRPLQEFVKGKLHLPLMLHPATQVTLTEFSSLASSENASAATAIRTLTDAIAFVQSKLEEHFPFAWVMFASDVSEVLIYRGHFIEGSDQAHLLFQSTALLRCSQVFSNVKRVVWFTQLILLTLIEQMA